MKKNKRYHLTTIYRGYNVSLTCCAHSYKEAAEKFDTTIHFVRNYAGCVDMDRDEENFEEVRAHIDSGYIIFEYGRKDLYGKEMPYPDLKKIIEHYVSIKYKI